MYKRLLPLDKWVEHKSIFLLGPRQTGKSTLLRHMFPEAVYYDLLEADTFREFSSRPETLRQSLDPRQKLVIVDEIQKLPPLLDEIQLLLDRNKSLRVILTGSSARKLRRAGTNLLAGRAWTIPLYPLVTPELGKPRLLDRFNRGSLPAIIDSLEYKEDLKAYVGTYLQEEIRAEGLTRSIGNFSRFLEVAGISNGQQINFTNVGNDAGVPSRTVREHYQILEDTLVGSTLPAYQKTLKRKPVATAKFFFFDLGVAGTLGRWGTIEDRSEMAGRALEHLIFLELKSFLGYHRIDLPLTYWRSLSQFEVDFVVGDTIAIEVKSKSRISDKDLKGLLALSEEVKLKKRIVVCRESRRRRTDDGIDIIPIESFLDLLWNGEIFS